MLICHLRYGIVPLHALYTLVIYKVQTLTEIIASIYIHTYNRFLERNLHHCVYKEREKNVLG